ncbi:MAG: hypothetical protein Q4D05_08785 [Acinetobacter sp.]|nr:hypothetical protein [Acinetobacter sp.]
MNKFAWLGVLSIATMTTVAWADTQPYSPETQSRIRIYGQNQKPTILHFEQDGKTKKINLGGSLGSAFGSFVGVAKNKSIGIPATEHSQNVQQKNGFLSKMTYQEFVIPANKAVKVRTAFQGLSNVNHAEKITTIHYQGSCQSDTLHFTPKAGKDYEVIPSASGCAGADLLEIHADGKTSLVQFN